MRIGSRAAVPREPLSLPVGSLRCFGVLLVAGAASACGHDRAIVKPPTPVRVGVVRELAAVGGARYSANIVPREQVPVAFKVGGYVKEITQRRGVDGRLRPLQAGDAVGRGAVLASIRDEDYAHRVEQARASLAASKASGQKASSDLKRAESLFASKSLTRAEYDAATAASDGERARGEGSEAQLQEAEQALADCALRSPLDGLVLERRLEAGSLAGTGSVAFVIADLSSMKAIFGVPDTVVGTLEMGATLTVTTDAVRGEEFQGRITAISPSADAQSRVFDVELTIPNPSRVLKSGMIATVRVREEPRGPAPMPAVPLSAIVRSGQTPEGYAVFVLGGQEEEGIARRRDVTLGDVYGNLIAISSGVAAGERVVVTGAALLTEGDRVQVVP